MAAQNVDQFDAYFRRADLDKDGRISVSEAVTFFQGANLHNQVLAQIWTHADHNKTGFLGRNEFYNALKLLTVAQSKRELTPDMVKATLYGPATIIPAPQINLAVQPALQPNSLVGPYMPQSHGAASTVLQTVGGRPQVAPSASMGQQSFPSQQNQSAKSPRAMSFPSNIHPQQPSSQRMPGLDSTESSHPPSTNNSVDWLGGGANVPSAGVTSQNSNRGIASAPNQVGFGMIMPGVVPGLQPTPQSTAMLTQAVLPKRDSPSMPSVQEVGKDPKVLAASGIGFMPGSVFGDASSPSSSLPKQDFQVSASSASSLTISSSNTPVSTVSQMAIKPGGMGISKDSFTQQSVGNQYQQIQTVKENPQVPLQNSTAKPSMNSSFGSGDGNLTADQSQAPWPKITQTDVQKYTRVFLAVDTDRDGKISGEQARNLFLSWRLPREVLKQVLDLSDQDNDSMLSLREFCISLYLMERFREGRSLPSMLPSEVILNEGLLPVTGQFSTAHNNASWRPSQGLQQSRGMPASQQSTHAARAKLSNQGPPSPADESMPPYPQKSKVPELENNLVDQLSEGERNSLNSKFQEAKDANMKVEELEKEIVESRQKIEFYSSKMQEIVLYKSRCDSRLNEISERVSADKREVESLAKKYEEKYKQRGDVASKLTIEEATFRDIQEKKMDMYRAIMKMDQDGKSDAIQVDADRIKLELEELLKSLNERCKTYSLRAKPTTLAELPFGWQSGIQEGAADWDENWDKFEDEGFTIAKELTLDVQNVVAPLKEKSLIKKEFSSAEIGTEVSSLVANGKKKKVPTSEENVTTNDAHCENGTTASPTDSPLGQKNASIKNSDMDASSPHDLDTHSEHGGTFDIHYDTNSVWDLNSGSNKWMEHSFFVFDELGLPPIRTDFSYRDNMPKKSGYIFTDSIPSSSNSPESSDNVFQNKRTSVFDSVPSTPQSDNFQNRSTFVFDSAPSTPQANNNLFENKSTFHFDSVPSTPQTNNNNNLFENKSTFQFDSVPSTPMSNNYSDSQYGFGEGPEIHESGPYKTSDSLARFDSFRSTADSDYGKGSFSRQDSLGRFDSFRSSRDSEGGHVFYPRQNYARFNSIRSNRASSDDSHGFPTFDELDPFGSSGGPFKASLESQTSRRDSDSWKPF